MVWQILNNLPEHDNDRQPQLTAAGGDCYTLCMGTEQHHTTVPVLPTLLAMLILQVGLLAAVFTVPVFSDALGASTNTFSVLQYTHVVFWALITFLTWHLYREFYHIWVLGYHSFYTTTQFLHGLSFYIYTSGLVLLCVLGAAVRDYCTGGALSPCGKHLHLSPVNYQQIVTVMLTLPAVLCTLKLAGEVYRFNQSEMPVDVLVDDLGIRLSQTTLYVGLGKPNSILTVLEVQGAVIASLRRRVEILNRQVAMLANNIESYLDPVE